MSKDDTISIINNSKLNKKGVCCNFFLLCIKSSEKTYYQKNKDMILNRANDYCENDKEKLREQARDKYRNLFEEEKNKKGEYGKTRYHKMSEEKKQKLKECKKNSPATKKLN